ncbi:MAG: hypothetical protein ACR652_22385 [Methylocystis sp.]|uniref:hypothetical protein n=1 Tax=Methylocystis sp. TaxID=1911079 RepID=UPI003DA55CB1
MVFLLKSFACIALVLFALGWRGFGAPDAVPERSLHGAASRDAAGAARHAAAADRPQNLAQAGVDALFSAARDKCLASPRDCAALLQNLPSARSGR